MSNNARLCRALAKGFSSQSDAVEMMAKKSNSDGEVRLMEISVLLSGMAASFEEAADALDQDSARRCDLIGQQPRDLQPLPLDGV